MASERPTFWQAACVSIWTSLLFLAVYNATNWISSWRSISTTVYFAWERHIPFVPEMILPYMSIDLGPGVFGKSAGRLPLASRIVLAPVLFGQYLSLLYYRRECRDWDEVTDRVWIGRCLKDCEAREAIAAGVTAVVDLTGEFSSPEPFLSVHYLHVPVLDLTTPSQSQLDDAVAFIAEETRHGVVYVHCKIGYSRSAAVVGSSLIALGHATTADEAMAMLQQARPSIVIRPKVQAAIRTFAARRRSEEILVAGERANLPIEAVSPSSCLGM